MRPDRSTLSSAAAAIRRGELRSHDLVSDALRTADELDGLIGAFVTRFEEAALEAAAEADRAVAAGAALGPLHGIPIGVKDIFSTREGPTTAQSAVLEPGWGGRRDAEAVARLRRAGAIVVGKTTTMEFACGTPDAADEANPFPVPRNPWDTSRWTGGSSSGSASGVAVGMFLGAVGSDTAGSVRIPSAFCGITGLKPTFGLVSKVGCFPLGFTVDHVGPMARTARDCAIMLAVMAGHDPDDPSSVARTEVPDYTAAFDADLGGLRVGVDPLLHVPPDCMEADVSSAFTFAVECLHRLGAKTVEVSLPLYDELVTADMVSFVSEGAAVHMNNLRTRWHEYGPARRVFGLASAFTGADYVQAQRVRRAGQEALQSLFTEVDVVVTPTLGVAAVALEQAEEIGLGPRFQALLTPYWNAVGAPALSVPMGFDHQGLPLGLQIAGRPFDEATVLRVGDAYQSVTDWHARTPPLAAARSSFPEGTR